MFWLVPWFTPALAQQWWSTEWEHRARLTFANGARTEDLIGFPVLAVLVEGVNFDHALAGPTGNDLRFVDADGVTVLPYEIEQWSPTGTSYVWVSVPQIDAASDADHVWLYFGGPATDVGEQPDAMWLEAAAVWHLDTFDDSAGNHGTWDDGTTGPAAGIAGLGRVMDGDAAIKAANDVAFSLQTELTVSAWIAVPVWHDSFDAIVTKGDETFRLHRCGDARSVAFALNFDDDAHDLCGTSDIDDGAWHQIVGVYDAPAGFHSVYVDGVLQNQVSESRLVNVSDNELWIGNNQDEDDRDLHGVVDEVRIEPVARSATWIAADEASVRDRLVRWCTPSLGLGDADLDGICDEDDRNLDDENETVNPRSDPRAPRQSLVPEGGSGPAGCGCTWGPNAGWGPALLVVGWLSRTGRRASCGSPGPRRGRARGRSASRATSTALRGRGPS